MEAIEKAVAGATEDVAPATENVAQATQQAAAAAVKVAAATENGIMFDAIAAVRKMVDAGVERLPAECIAGLVQDNYRITRAIVVDELDRRQFATQQDLTDKLSAVEKDLSGKLSAVEKDLSDRLSAVEKDLAEVSTKVDSCATKADLAAMKAQLLLWLGGGLVATVGAIAALVNGGGG